MTRANRFRFGPRVHISAKKMAEWSLLCCRLFSRPLPANLAHRSFDNSENSSSHRVHLPIYESMFHLLLTRKLLPYLLFRRWLTSRPYRRSLRAWYRQNHLRCPPLHLRVVNMYAIYPLPRKSTPRCCKTLHDIHDNVRNNHGLHYLRLHLHRLPTAQKPVRRPEDR